MAMAPRTAANRSAAERPAAKPSMRFSLRSLFLVSAAIALPLLMLANLRGNRRLEDSLGSPVYLLAAVAAMIASAAIGSALGHKVGTIATAIAAGIAWITLIILLCGYSPALARLAPGHVVAAVATVAAIIVAVYRQRDPPDLIPPDYYSRLRDVRDKAREEMQTGESNEKSPPPDVGDDRQRLGDN
jgi:hypothetical protein